MSPVLCLPSTPEQVRQRTSGSLLPTVPDQTPEAVGALADAFAKCQSVTQVVGSLQTPLIYWLAAKQFLPHAALLQSEENGAVHRISLNSTESSFKESAAEPQQQADTDKQATESDAESVQPQKPSVSRKAINHWVFDVYRYHAWGELKIGEQKYREAADRAVELSDECPDLIEKLDWAVRQGKHAWQLTQALRKRFENGTSREDIQAWVKRVTDSASRWVAETVKIQHQKQLDRQKNARERFRAGKNFQVNLPQYSPAAGETHPQALRSLTPSQQWTILIDEGGQVFDEQAEQLTDADRRLGRVVALAIPQRTTLKELKQNYHATEEADEAVQEIVSRLMNAEVGILGATLKRDLFSANWIGAIQKLIHWTLLLLPIQGQTHVRILIEQRHEYKAAKDKNVNPLKGLKDVLQSELKLLSPQRFDQLSINLDIMDKKNPLNGYVDTIAHLWSSPSSTRRTMLSRTGWLGHCLLQNTSLTQTEHLYHRVAQQPDDIDPDDWFELCHQVSQEPCHSLLNDVLEQLGQRAAEDEALWQKCLSQVQHQIQIKHFSPSHLDRALAWLEAYRPEGRKLPRTLLLELESARLAADNHLGRADPERIRDIMQLTRELQDEMPSEACQGALRVAIAATNAFDFSSATPYIEQWLAEPVAVPGLLNHAKLRSTMGQLKAFNGDNEGAISEFDQALTLFSSLADPQQAERESRQTRSYRAIAAIADNQGDASEQILSLLRRVTGENTTKTIRKLARSGSERRFEHYLLLRLLISNSIDVSLRDNYLAVEDEWQYQEGHPWMLINAYRGWLMAKNGQTEQATALFRDAVESCREDASAAILQWMGDVLAALACSLELSSDHPSDDAWLDSPFPGATVKELAQAKTDEARHSKLMEALPFNFH